MRVEEITKRYNAIRNNMEICRDPAGALDVNTRLYERAITNSLFREHYIKWLKEPNKYDVFDMLNDDEFQYRDALNRAVR